MARLFSKQELKITKYNLMKHHGYTEEKARDEIEGMIAMAEYAHEQSRQENNRKKMKEKRYKKGRIQMPNTHTSFSDKN